MTFVMPQPDNFVSRGSPSPNKTATPDAFRETIESLATAFILFLMIKAFVVEAFVIPTGSMAPTLMGAHKDVTCNDCGFPYRCGASFEFSEAGTKSGGMVFGTVCPLCRKPQVLDLANNSNHRTFAGDRILVSKLAYAFSKPQRWQVFVFKFPARAHQNYIKRCLGTPNETIRIEHGDVYFSEQRPAHSFEIARKPPEVIQAMLQPLSDTRYLSKSLLLAKVPDAWQPADPGSRHWKIGNEEGTWTASAQGVPSGTLSMIRYRHRVLDPNQWEPIRERRELPQPIAADSYRLITDFTAYNHSVYFPNRMDAIPANYSEIAPIELDQTMHGRFPAQSNEPSTLWENDGVHWVGDLSGSWEITTEPATEVLRLLLVEAGVEHRCDIDLKTGLATATSVYEGKTLTAFEGADGTWVDSIQATTQVRAGAKHRLQFANVDDSLTLWVDHSPVSWGNRGRFSVRAQHPGFRNTPRTAPDNPLDTAPLGIGIRGGGCTITHARVDRDIYYIAHGPRGSMSDYPNLSGLLRTFPEQRVRSRYVQTYHNVPPKEYDSRTSRDALARNAIMSDVNAWSGSPLDTERRAVTFELDDDAYFPLGDNSSQSADARSWNEPSVPERLMIGRAVLIFWPHYWNAPIPFLPNFQRMGLIR